MRLEVNKVRLTVLIALLFSALCAGVFRTPPILFMAALLCSAPFVGIIIGTLGSRGLRLKRFLPESGMVGDIVVGEISIDNTARWPAFLVHARCGIGPVDSSGKQSTRDAASAALTPIGDDEWVAPFLRSHERAAWKQQWILNRRGVHLLEPARAGALDPLGLYNRMSARSEAHQIVVVPRPVRIEKLGFLGGIDAASPVPRHATTVADATDFHGVRPWQRGEAIRRAHWKSTARTGQLHVIEWEETPTADLAIFLDTHQSSIAGEYSGSTLEASITAAASIVCHLLENGCRIQIFFYLPDAGTEAAAAHPRKHLRPSAQPSSPPVKPVLQQLQAHSVEGIGAVLRALAEITPVRHVAGALPHLVEEGLPQISRGMGVVLLASARADLTAALEKAQAGRPEAQSSALAFEAGTAPSRAAASRHVSTSSSGTGSEVSRAVEAAVPSSKARVHTASRSRGKSRRQAIQTIHTGDSLAAALERSF